MARLNPDRVHRQNALRLALAAFLALYGFQVFAGQALVDQDLFGHLAFGRATCQLGHVLRQDPYAYVHTLPWTNHEWLSEAFFYLLLSIGGGVALLAFKAIAGSATALAMGAAASARPVDLLVVAAVAAVALHGLRDTVHVRPYVFTYGLFAVTLAILEWGRRRPLLAWILPPMMAGWANLHAGFVVGLGTAAIYVAGAAFEKRRRDARVLAAATGVAALATVLNPYGIHYWPFVLSAVTMARPYITEFRPLPWSGSTPLPFLGGVILPVPWFWECKALLVVLGVAVAFAVWKRRLGRTDVAPLLVTAVTACMAIQHYRHVPLFLVAAAAYAPGLLSRLRSRVPIAEAHAAPWQDPSTTEGSDRFESDRPWRHRLAVVGLAAVLAAGGVVRCLPELRRGLVVPLSYARASYRFPVRAVIFMRDNGLAGNTLCFFDWGEFLIWELWPTCRVAFDGRLETVYPSEVITQNLDFTAGRPAGIALLEAVPTDLILARPRGAALVRRRPGWIEAFRDDDATLFVRDVPSHRGRVWKVPAGPAGDAISLDAWLRLSPWAQRPVPEPRTAHP